MVKKVRGEIENVNKEKKSFLADAFLTYWVLNGSFHRLLRMSSHFRARVLGSSPICLDPNASEDRNKKEMVIKKEIIRSEVLTV